MVVLDEQMSKFLLEDLVNRKTDDKVICIDAGITLLWLQRGSFSTL
jgi:hypothetical protein